MSATTSPPTSPSAAARFWWPVGTLAVRELVRFARQRTRIIGALGQPVIFWILFGAGLKGSFTGPNEADYQTYFFPGVAVLVLLFTAIFSTISIIEDRKEGFLQGVLAAPVPRTAIVLGKLLGGTILAVLQAGLFLVLGATLHLAGLAPTMPLDVGPISIVATFAFVVLLAFTLTALGYCIAWPMDSTQGFHAIMSVFLMPMWLVSGAFFPGSESGWLSWVIRLNPLTYGVAGLRRLLYGDFDTASATYPSMPVCVVVSVGFALVCSTVAVWLTNRRTSPDRR